MLEEKKINIKKVVQIKRRRVYKLGEQGGKIIAIKIEEGNRRGILQYAYLRTL